MTQLDTSLERISSLIVDRGLYLLRYDACADINEPPVALVRKAQGCEISIQIISEPGASPGRKIMSRVHDALRRAEESAQNAELIEDTPPALPEPEGVITVGVGSGACGHPGGHGPGLDPDVIQWAGLA